MRPAAILLLSVSLAAACAERPAASDRTEPSRSAAAVASAPPAPTSAVAAQTPAARADEFYARRCLACHGPSGHGDGPGAALIKPPPRSFADPQWQKSVSDEYIAEIMVKGGVAVKKSPAMPPSPELGNDAELRQALVAKVRGFAK